jgi:lipopolysaccharide export system protein LptA
MTGPLCTRPPAVLGACCAATLLALWFIAPAGAAPPPPPGPITLVADHIQYNTQTGVVVADGHVKATRDDAVITADHLEGNLQTGDVVATGHVTLSQTGRTVTGESLVYNYRTRAGRMEQAVTKYGPWTVTSGSLETSAGQGVAYNTAITPCDPRHPAFLVRARRLVVVPGDYMKAYGASLYVYGVRVLTIPVYTASLRPSRHARSGPTLGYDSLSGAWIEYGQFSTLGGAENQLRVRYGTLSGVTVEDILAWRQPDHVYSFHLGRAEVFDQNGNEFNVDQYSLDVVFSPRRMGHWPVLYSFEAHGGSYAESALGLPSNHIATRGEALVNFTSDVLRLSPSVTWAASGQARVDAYGTGQQRSVLGATIGFTDILNRSSSLSLTYNFADVNGTTPFLFDVISADSTVALSYGYGGPGVLQFGGISFGYSFLSRQTSLGVNVGLAITPRLILTASGDYILSTGQWSEVDYAINVQCDCLSVGVLFRTFPASPSQNQFYLTLGITAFPQTFTTLKF